jgi:hypothetical protein
MDMDTTGQQDEKISSSEQELMDRRGFLQSLKKWSKIVIGGAVAGSALLNHTTEVGAAGWANRGGGGGGGGGAWANRAGGGGAWANNAGGGGAWANRGAAWANRGSAWANRF